MFHGFYIPIFGIVIQGKPSYRSQMKKRSLLRTLALLPCIHPLPPHAWHSPKSAGLFRTGDIFSLFQQKGQCGGFAGVNYSNGR